MTATLPMPGDTLGSDIVIASCWQNDTAGDGPISAAVLVLQSSAPFYVVMELEHSGDEWRRAVATSYPNIVPASEAYAEATGGY